MMQNIEFMTVHPGAPASPREAKLPGVLRQRINRLAHAAGQHHEQLQHVKLTELALVKIGQGVSIDEVLTILSRVIGIKA